LEAAWRRFSFLVSAIKHFFTVKTFYNEIIDEYRGNWPVVAWHNGLCRQREGKGAEKEGADDTDLRPELPASLSSDLPSRLLPEKGMILILK
jgi:hypothetical protein